MTSTSALYPQPSTLPDSAPLYKPGSAISRPEHQARGFYTTLTNQSKLPEDDHVQVRYLEFIDMMNNAKTIFAVTAVWEHLSFAKDWIKYRFNYNNQLLPIETQRLKPNYVVRTIYSAHLGRCLKFFPMVAALFEGPYIITGDQRWSPGQYIATGAALGFYYGILTKRTPLFLTSSTFVPAALFGVYGHLEDLRGQPLIPKNDYLGQRRLSDEEANGVITKTWAYKYQNRKAKAD